MSLIFQTLADMLPPGSVEYVGNNQLKINLTQMTGESLNFQSSCVEPIIKLMNHLVNVTNAVNASRATANPPRYPIAFVSKDLIGTPDAPELEYTMRVAVDTNQFLNNLIDPTDD